MFKKVKIALALGGGGARGFAHIGVIRALTGAGITIDLITGSGIGAVVGGMYAQLLDIDAVEQKIRRFFFSEDFKKTGMHLFRRDMHPENFFGQISRAVGNDLMIQLYGNRMSLMKENRIGVIMDELLGEGLLENTRIQFAPVATDLETGVATIFRTGSLKEGIKASSSIPGFLPPLSYKNHVFIDGAVAAPVPVESAHELGATFVMAVPAGRTLVNEPMPVNMMETVFRSHLISVIKAESLLCEKADVCIQPKVGHRHWAEFDQMDEFIAAGSAAVESSLDTIRVAIRKSGGKISDSRQKKSALRT